MENFDENVKLLIAQYELIYKKFIKVKKDYNSLKETNFKLLKFQDKKERIINKLKKILSKIEGLKRTQ